MRLRTGPFLLGVLAFALPPCLKAVDLDGSPASVGNAEAKRLYDDANDYVLNVTEGGYSYAYMQFYWRRAEDFVERAERVYPDSPTGRALKAGELKLGPFSLDYFRNRVLPRLEVKRVSAYDPVNCAIFLYERDPRRQDEEHRRAFEDIIEVMSRQARWGEVLGFRAQGVQSETDLLRVMFREATRARGDEHVIINQLLLQIPAAQQAEAQFPESEAEGLVLLGMPRTLLASFLTQHPQDSVKLAALQAMVDREVQIQRRAALRLPPGVEIDTPHYVLLRLSTRDNVDSVARQFWPGGNLPGQAREILQEYRAGLGERPAAEAALPVHLAYLDYLAAFERFDDMEQYGKSLRLDASDRQALALKMVELYARGGREADAGRWDAPFRAAGGAEADRATLADFEGRLGSTADPVVIRQQSFAQLPIQDPCLLAQAVMDWSLAPVRDIRGAAPWDAVVLKYMPGFQNLPPPTSEELRKAAAATEPF